MRPLNSPLYRYELRAVDRAEGARLHTTRVMGPEATRALSRVLPDKGAYAVK